MLRAGTNPGAMVREAINAESNADFIHKMSIAQKEIGETLYWLELLFRTDFLNEIEYKSVKNDADEVMKIVRSCILTLKKKMKNSYEK